MVFVLINKIFCPGCVLYRFTDSLFQSLDLKFKVYDSRSFVGFSFF